MTQIVDYGTLKTAIAREMNRTDLTADLPGFVQRAEEFFNRELRHRKNLYRYVNFPLTAEYTNVPSDLIEWVAIEAPVNGVRKTIGIEAISTGLNRRGLTAGAPGGFTVLNDSIRLSPPPVGTVTVDLLYYRGVPTIIGSDTDTNWLLDDHSGAYLYRSLMEAAMMRRDKERLADYMGVFQALWESVLRQGRTQMQSSAMQVKLGA